MYIIHVYVCTYVCICICIYRYISHLFLLKDDVFDDANRIQVVACRDLSNAIVKVMVVLQVSRYGRFRFGKESLKGLWGCLGLPGRFLGVPGCPWGVLGRIGGVPGGPCFCHRTLCPNALSCILLKSKICL